MQRDFFARFLKGDAAAWPDKPRVRLQVRHLDRFEPREAAAWPLPLTRWTRLNLDLGSMTLGDVAGVPATASFDATGHGLTLLAPPVATETEVTGPIALTLFVTSSTADADLFATVRVFDPSLKEVVFQGAIDPRTPIAQGWLRSSQRRLNPALSEPYRPYHNHIDTQPLVAGEIVELNIEIWPTSIVIPAGYRLSLSIAGRDYENAVSGGRMSNFKNEFRGCGPFLHDDPLDRPAGVFDGVTTLHAGPGHEPFLLLPVIPSPQDAR